MDMVLEACKSAGAQCEKVHIEDYSIECCVSCSDCTRGVECRTDDDYLHLKAKMLDADGIIIGSPYYNGKPVDSLKILFDRLSMSAASRKAFHKKCLLGISNSAVSDSRPIAEYCASLGGAALPGGAVISGLVFECIVTEDGVRDIENEISVRERVQRAANKFIADIGTETSHVSFANRIKGMFAIKNLKPHFHKLLRRKKP